MPSLAALFEAHLPPGVRPAAREDLSEEIARFVEAARALWPSLALDLGVFIGDVARCSSDGRLPPLARAPDLYLARACLHGIAGAHSLFDERYARGIARAVSLGGRSSEFVAEVTQRVRERLFVCADGPPAIAEYAGRAALQTWLSVAASREALNLERNDARWHRRTRRGHARAAASSPELLLLRRRYAPHFEQALEGAIARLPARERTVLKLNVVDRLGIDAIGDLYEVGRSTAARWLAAARSTLVMETRRTLREKLALTDSEYESLAGLIQSQLEASIVKVWLGSV